MRLGNVGRFIIIEIQMCWYFIIWFVMKYGVNYYNTTVTLYLNTDMELLHNCVWHNDLLWWYCWWCILTLNTATRMPPLKGILPFIYWNSWGCRTVIENLEPCNWITLSYFVGSLSFIPDISFSTIDLDIMQSQHEGLSCQYKLVTPNECLS